MNWFDLSTGHDGTVPSLYPNDLDGSLEQISTRFYGTRRALDASGERAGVC